MNVAAQNSERMSVEQYLESELLSDVRREYCAGYVYAMGSMIEGTAGSSFAHNVINGTIFAELYAHLRGRVCEPFSHDMKVRIRRGSYEWFYYPDVIVNCDPLGQQEYFCETPMVIVEVLSARTARVDREEKRRVYQLLASLHTYILVAQDRRELTVFRRSGGEWKSEILPEQGTELRIPELEFSLSLDAIYARTGI